VAVKGAEGAVANIIATLQAHLGAELSLISTEMGDGLPIPDVAAGDYFDWTADEGYIANSPSITVNAEGTTMLEALSTLQSPGLDRSIHRIRVGVHLKPVGNVSNLDSDLKKRLLRYARAVVRVLVLKYPTLPSGAVETVVYCRREGEAVYKRVEQNEGQYVLTADIPFQVETYENL
jgi:hypothetical protein